MPRHQNTVSRIPVPVSKNIPPSPPPEKKKKRKSTLFAPTCSRMAREADNFNNRTTKRAITRTTGLPKKDPTSKNNKQNKIPIDHLKNDYLQLKKKIHKDEKVIMKQAEEITRLKKWVTNTMHRIEITEKETNLETRKKELELELEKVRLEKQMSVAVQTEHASLEAEMNKLKKQLEIQETNHNLKLAEYNKLLCTKDNQIQQQQLKYTQVQRQHANTIQQLNALHASTIKSIESQTNETLESQLERILIEFEQEQHHHPIVPKQECIIDKKSVQYNINQQWWSKQFIPTDAASWPSPQPLSNLRKPIIDKHYCI